SREHRQRQRESGQRDVVLLIPLIAETKPDIGPGESAAQANVGVCLSCLGRQRAQVGAIFDPGEQGAQLVPHSWAKLSPGNNWLAGFHPEQYLQLANALSETGFYGEPVRASACSGDARDVQIKVGDVAGLMPSLGGPLKVSGDPFRRLEEAKPLPSRDGAPERRRDISKQATLFVLAARGFPRDAGFCAGNARAATTPKLEDLGDLDIRVRDGPMILQAGAGQRFDDGVVAQQDRRASKPAARLFDPGARSQNCGRVFAGSVKSTLQSENCLARSHGRPEKRRRDDHSRRGCPTHDILAQKKWSIRTTAQENTFDDNRAGDATRGRHWGRGEARRARVRADS